MNEYIEENNMNTCIYITFPPTNWHANSDCLQRLGRVLIIILRQNVFTTSRHLNNWIRIEIGKREEKDSLTHTHTHTHESERRRVSCAVFTRNSNSIHIIGFELV